MRVMYRKRILHILLTVMILTIVFAGSSAYAAWVSPTSHSDPNGQWTNETRAYDDNTSTYASHGGGAGWRGFIVLNVPNIAYCDRVRVSSDFGYGIVDAVDIDVYADGSWVDAYQGAINDVSWTEVTFTAQTNVTAVRFRYHYTSGGWQFWLYELDAWSGTPPAPPTVQTDPATSTSTNSANLHGELLTDGGETCEYSFEYGTDTSYGNTTAWTGNLAAGNTFSQYISGLTAGVTYHFRARARNDQGTATGDDMTFFTGSPSSGWVSPTGSSDSSGDWQDEDKAYDNELSTYAYAYHDINDPDGQWSFFLVLTLDDPITCDRIRFNAKSSDIDRADIDIYDGSSWTGVYNSDFSDQTFVEQGFTQQTVSQARIRFRVDANNKGLYWQLYEFDFQKVSLNVPTLAWTGETNYGTDGVDPEQGYRDTDFEFRVQYTDADNDGPAIIQVWVDKNGDGDYLDSGEKLDMTVASDAAAAQRDGDYTNGEVFTATTTIPYGPNSTNVSYLFYANDGSDDATGTPTTAVNEPDVYPTLDSITLSDQDGVNSPDPEYTNGQTVSVTLVPEGSPTQMMLSEASDFSGASWVAYASPTTYTFSNTTNELKTVYAKLRYASGPDSQTKNDTITLDTVVPTVGAAVVTAPNGAESWAAGSAQNITWNPGGISDANLKTNPVALFYSTNSGSTFPNTVATGEANDGTYPWTVASVDSDTVQIRVTAYDLAGNEASDESDADFSITLAPTLDWTGEARYGSDGLDPEVGYSDTDFVYRVDYLDIGNDAPTYVRVHIDKDGDGIYESVNDMNEADAGDSDYTDGKIYTYTTTIPYGPNTDNCAYYFSAHDGEGAATGAPTTPVNAPDVLQTLSLSVNTGTYAFGIVDPGTYTTAASPIEITNDGDGTEDFKLQITNAAADWTTLETAADPGVDEYKLLALLNSSAPGDIFIGDDPAEGTSDIIFESTQKNCDASNFSGDQTGDDVPTSGTRDLWFRFGAPSTTAVTAQQVIVVTIQAFGAGEF
ncbi:MAG: hypothetical protein GF333_04945 [Candidatus Omnitrophica bacterium]|nr:hypothetical protein [Candidatus Omnitrophota bacterium]